MARMTLSELVDEVDPWRRDLDTTEVGRLANFILRDLGPSYGRSLRTTFTTTAPDTTPTVDATQGSTSVTVASGTFATTNDGQLIQIEGGDAWYEISGTVADTSFTISSGFEGDTGTGLTVTVAYPRVALPTGVVSIQGISRPGKTPLGRVDGEFPPEGATNLSTSEPRSYYEVEPTNSDDALEIMLVDPPDDVYTYTVQGRDRVTRFTSSSGSKCGLSEANEDVLIAGTLWLVLNMNKGAEEGAFWYTIYEDKKRSGMAGKGPTFAGGAKTAGGAGERLYFRHPRTVTDL